MESEKADSIHSDMFDVCNSEKNDDNLLRQNIYHIKQFISLFFKQKKKIL